VRLYVSQKQLRGIGAPEKDGNLPLYKKKPLPDFASNSRLIASVEK